MKKVLTWFFGTVLVVLIAVLVFAGIMYSKGSSKVSKVYETSVDLVPIASDSATIALGRYIANTHGCISCHGMDFSGQILADVPPFRLVPTNLTPGRGGIGTTFTDEDWLRAIRHGVGKDGRGLWVMPSEAYFYLSDEEAGALVAFLKQLDPVDNELPRTELKALGRVIAGLDPKMSPVPDIMLDEPRMEMPVRGPTAEWGRYRVTTFCGVCHGMDIRGHQPPDPASPYAPDLRVAAGWGLEAFTRALRTGVVPGDRILDPEFMPWTDTARMTDEEIEALFRYIETQVD